MGNWQASPGGFSCMLVSNAYVNTSAKESPGKLFCNSHEHAVGRWSETCEFRSLKEFSSRAVYYVRVLRYSERNMELDAV